MLRIKTAIRGMKGWFARQEKDNEIPTGKPVITFLSQPIKGMEDMAEVVLKAMKTFPEKQLVVKLHPREYSENFYRETAKRIGVKIVITRDSDLYDLISISDGIIGLSSTACLEALMLNKSRIIVNLTKTKRSFPSDEKFSAIGVHRGKDIRKAILRLEKQKEELEIRGRGFIHEYAYKIDGKAAKRVAGIVDKLLS